MKTTILILIASMSLNLFAARTKEERKALFQNANKELKDTGIEKRILKKGDKFPDLMLGNKKVSEWLKNGPVVVTFYRGGWCPYCVQQLKELDNALGQLKEKKTTLIAISPESANEVRKTKSKNNLDFLLLSDKGNELARKLNLVFKVDDEVAKEYKALGIDLEKSQDNKKNELPVPATFVIREGNIISYVFADADYTKRAPLSDILNAL